MSVSAHLFAQLFNAIKNGSATEELTAILDLFDGPGDRYYVNSAVGNDNHAGTSWEAPLATIDAAVNKCSANDTVLVAAG